MFMQELLKKELTEPSYNLLEALLVEIPSVWRRPSSSSGKYHQKENGYVPTIAEHTAEMLLAGARIARLFKGCERNCVKKDTFLMAIVLHDSMKYGKDPSHSKHTVSNHDKIAADFIHDVADIFESVIGAENTALLEDCVRLHNGRWSPGFSAVTDQMVFMVHHLDMLSTSDNLRMTDKQILHYWPNAFGDDIPF